MLADVVRLALLTILYPTAKNRIADSSTVSGGAGKPPPLTPHIAGLSKGENAIAFQRVPKTIEMLIRGTFQGSRVENGFYYTYTGTMTQSRLDAAVAAFYEAFQTNWLPLLSTGYQLGEIYARDLDAEVAVQSTQPGGEDDAGAITGDTLPNYATIAMARKSGMTGRKSRGRIFWPGLAESQVTNNAISPELASDMQGAAEALDSAMALLELGAAIVSRVAAGDDPLVATVYELATWGFTNLLVDTRRSRKIGTGI